VACPDPPLGRAESLAGSTARDRRRSMPEGRRDVSLARSPRQTGENPRAGADTRPARRRWHNDPRSNGCPAFAPPVLAAPSPPDPRPPRLGLPDPASRGGSRDPGVADARGVPAAPAIADAPHRRVASGRARAAARATGDATVSAKPGPAGPAGALRPGAATPARPGPAERGQAARASTACADAACTGDATVPGASPFRAPRGGQGAGAGAAATAP
jgi:hypothetical protein